MDRKFISTHTPTVQPQIDPSQELAQALRAIRKLASLARRQGDAGRNLLSLELRNLTKAVTA